MSIDYRGENRWRFRITMNGRSSTKTYYSTVKPKTVKGEVVIPKEVKVAHADFEVSIQRGETLAPNKLSLNDLYKLVDEQYFKTLSASTQETYTSTYYKHIEPVFGNYKISEIKKIDVQKLINEKSNHYAERTVNMIYGVFSKIFTKATEWELIDKNPCSCLVVPDIPKSNYEQLLSEADISKLLYVYDKEPNTMHKLAFMLAFGCGLRHAEILALTIDDFNFEKNIISVTKQMGKVKNSTGKTVRAEKSTKSSNSVRKIYAPNFVMSAAKEHIAQMNPIPFTKQLFWSDETQRVVDQPYIRNYFKDVLKNNGIKEIRFHDLRHLKATLMLNSGSNVVTVARTLGDTVDTVIQNYTHTIDETEIKSAGEFNNLVDKFRAK